LRARGEDFGQGGGTVPGVADELCLVDVELVPWQC